MQYQVVKPVYLNGKEYGVGETVVVQDEAVAQKLLERGTLTEGGSESTTPLADSSEPAQPQVPEQPPVDPTVAQEQAQQVPQKGQPTPDQITQDLEVLENGSNPSAQESEGEKPNVQIS